MPSGKLGFLFMEVEPEYIWRKAKDIATAEAIMKADKEKGPWGAIEEMFKWWKKERPQEYKAFIVDVELTKKTRLDKFGASKDKNSGMRYTLDIPEKIWQMIAAMYGDKEKIDIYDKKFFREMGRRFPFLKVAERL